MCNMLECVDLFTEFKFDGFSTDTCRSLVAMKDVSLPNLSCCLSVAMSMLCICIGQNIKSRKRPSGVCGRDCDVIHGPIHTKFGT